jgi:TetR/AcrR family transcriptional regulator, transcriptional repressor for nem operon
MPRAKAFDPEEALQKAMQILWEHGDGATSGDMLVQGMGIHRFSLYSTFGGQHQLLVAALDRYRDTMVADLVGELEHTVSRLAAIRQFFTHVVDFLASAHGWRGCFITNTAVELAPHDPQAAANVQASVVRLEEAFDRVVLQAQQTQPLAASSTCRDLARVLTGSALGLGVLAKTLPGRQALDGDAAVVWSVLA